MCSTFKICIFYNGTHRHPSMVPDQRWCGMFRLGHSHYAAPPNSHQKFLTYSECEPSLAAPVAQNFSISYHGLLLLLTLTFFTYHAGY